MTRAPSPPSRKGASARQSGAAQAGLDPRQGADLAGIPRNAPPDARAQAQHGLRRSGLPQYRRVLEAEARHGDDPGQRLHPRLQLLQCGDRPARPARPARAGACRRSRGAAGPQPYRRHLGRSRRSRGWRRRALRAHHPRHPRGRARHHHRGADPRFPARRTARSRRWSRPGPTSSTTISRPCRGFMPRCGRARAISIRCASWTGSRSSTPPCSPNPASWSGSARTRRKCCR